MAVTIKNERRMFTEAEFDAVASTHYPQVCGLPKEGKRCLTGTCGPADGDEGARIAEDRGADG